MLTALIVGSGWRSPGTTFQGLLRNPLADPYVLGTASGAALGAAIAVLIPVQVALLGFGLVHLLAFAGALIAVAARLRLAGGGGRAELDDVPAPDRLRGRVAARGGLAVAMYLSGAAPAPDLLLPAGQLRAGRSWQQLAMGLPIIVVGSGSSWSAPARSMPCCWARRPPPTWAWTCVASARSCSGWPSLVTAAAVALAG